MPGTIHPVGADGGSDEFSTEDELRRLTAHVASLDLDAPTLEILMAALTVDVSDEAEAGTVATG